MDLAEQLLNIYDITEEDLSLVRKYGETVTPLLGTFVEEFYAWLRPQPEFIQYFSDSELLEQVQQAQIKYWKQTFAAQIDQDYIHSRQNLGSKHAQIGLDLSTYFSGMSKSLTIFNECFLNAGIIDDQFRKTQVALAKVVHMDTAIVVQAYVEINQQKIDEQNRALLEMSTPVTAVWDGVLMLPIVGVLSSTRAQEMMHSVLQKISDTGSKVIIMDISGVAVVDSAVANHIIKITKATKLMGCDCLVSGLSPAIAQTIVDIGIDVTNLTTTSSLRDALLIAFKLIGTTVKQ